MKHHLPANHATLESWKIFLGNCDNLSSYQNNLAQASYHFIENKKNDILEEVIKHINPNEKNEFCSHAVNHQNPEAFEILLKNKFSIYTLNQVGRNALEGILGKLPKDADPFLKILMNEKIMWGVQGMYGDYPIYSLVGTEYFSPVFEKMTDKKKREMLLMATPEKNLLVVLASNGDVEGGQAVFNFINKEKMGFELASIIFPKTNNDLLIECSKFEKNFFVKNLYETNAFHFQTFNNEGENALFSSLSYCNIANAQYLLDLGAKLFIKNFSGQKPEDVLKYYGHDESRKEKIKLFIDANKEKFEIELALQNPEQPEKKKKKNKGSLNNS